MSCDSPCHGGVENGGPWWPKEALEVVGLLFAAVTSLLLLLVAVFPELEKKAGWWLDDSGGIESDGDGSWLLSKERMMVASRLFLERETPTGGEREGSYSTAAVAVDGSW